MIYENIWEYCISLIRITKQHFKLWLFLSLHTDIFFFWLNKCAKHATGFALFPNCSENVPNRDPKTEVRTCQYTASANILLAKMHYNVMFAHIHLMLCWHVVKFMSVMICGILNSESAAETLHLKNVGALRLLLQGTGTIEPWNSVIQEQLARGSLIILETQDCLISFCLN